MQMLYDSDTFVVVHINANKREDSEPSFLDGLFARHGFEIVDKRTNKEVYLDGDFARIFQDKINSWQLNTPHQEEVEAYLDGISELAQNPLVIH